jgi:phage terminase large subunit GpA-like protein
MNFFSIGVDTAKDTIYGRLRIDRPGPGYIHFPVGAPFDQTYFDQLTAERVVTRFRMGRPYRVWDAGGKANEALDTFVYALAARMSLPRSRTIVVGRPAPAGVGGVVPTQEEVIEEMGEERARVSLAKRLPH